MILPANEEEIGRAVYVGPHNETEYRFDGIVGLVLHVSRGGMKTWKVHYSITKEGVRKKGKVKLGRHPAMSLAMAKRAMSDFNRRLIAEKDLHDERRSSVATPETSLVRGAIVEVRDAVDILSNELSSVSEELRLLKLGMADIKNFMISIRAELASAPIGDQLPSAAPDVDNRASAVVILSIHDAAERFGVSTSTLKRGVKTGSFPSPVKLSKSRVGWLDSDISQWQLQRARERNPIS